MNNQPKPPIFVRPLLFLSGNGKYLKTFEWAGGIFFFMLIFLTMDYVYNIWFIHLCIILVISFWYQSAKKWIIHNK